jgi:hypothetical protein
MTKPTGTFDKTAWWFDKTAWWYDKAAPDFDKMGIKCDKVAFALDKTGTQIDKAGRGSGQTWSMTVTKPVFQIDKRGFPSVAHTLICTVFSTLERGCDGAYREVSMERRFHGEQMVFALK